PLLRADLFDALNDERDGQRIAGGEDGVVSRWELIEVALDEDGAESAEADDPGSCLDCVRRGRPNPCQVLPHTGGIQTVGRNERVDVKTMRLRVGDRFHLDAA